MLLPFRNVTRAAASDWLITGAPLMLGQALGQFTDLTIVPESRLTAAMRRFGLALDVPPDATQLQRLAEATDGWTAVSGTVIATGGKMRISAEALDIPTSSVVARAVTDVDTSADIRQAFDRLTVQLLPAVGVRGQSNLIALTTKSVDAYRAYADGVAFMQQGAFRRAVAALTEAVRIDSSFALAWSVLSFATMQAGGLAEILNPLGMASRAAEQAARHSARLSPRQAGQNRVLQAAFHGDFARAHRLADSLVATDPNDVSALTWLGMIEMLDSRLDTTRVPVTRAGSMNRSIEMMNRVLERDPSQMLVYVFPATIYGFTAGLLSDIVGGRRKPVGSLAFEFLLPFDVNFQPVLRDSIVYIVDSDYVRIPLAERQALKLRGANAGADWTNRWITASPNDPEAHLWASRFAELLGDYDHSLAELSRVLSLGSESNLENLRARRMSLLELSGNYDAAVALADSIVQAGGVNYPPRHSGLDRSRSYAIVTYLRTKQWSKAAKVVAALESQPGEAKCERLSGVFQNRQFTVAAQELKAIADSVAAHLDEVRRVPELAPCANELAKPPV